MKMYKAKNRVTGQETGPFTEEYKTAIEANRSTWKRYIWTEVILPSPNMAEKPDAIARVVKPAKQGKAEGTSADGE